MSRKNLKLGDYTDWNIKTLYKNLEKIVMAKQSRRVPYFIWAHIKSGYDGAPAKCDNEIFTGMECTDVCMRPTQNLNLEGKHVTHVTFTIAEGPPSTPLIGLLVFKVDNVLGTVKPVSCLPPDVPVDSNIEMTEHSEFVAESAKLVKGALAYNVN